MDSERSQSLIDSVMREGDEEAIVVSTELLDKKISSKSKESSNRIQTIKDKLLNQPSIRNSGTNTRYSSRN